jgi:ubiquinone/menaquinone biosynthesis C-methylase UbiE
MVNTYYQSIAPVYVRLRRVHPEVLRSLVSIGALSPASSVLDVGCGTGNYLLALSGIVGCDCWGIDSSEAMLAEAQSQLTKAHLYCAPAERMKLPADQFDLVFAVDVVHHLGDRGQVFRECLRVLRPGGNFCLVTESAEMIRRREPHASYFPDAVEIELARYPSVVALKSELHAAGFVELQQLEVECHAELTDIEPYRTKVHSSLQLMSNSAFNAGIERLEQDLRSGPIPYTWRYLLLSGTKRAGD